SIAGHVVVVDELVMVLGVAIGGRHGTGAVTDALEVAAPGEAGGAELAVQRRTGEPTRRGAGIVVGATEAEALAAFQPQVVGQAGVVAGRVVVLLGVGGLRQQRSVEVGRRGAA